MPQFKGLWDNERATLDAIGADLIIPLKVKGDVIGIFCVGPKLSGETYTQDDQLTLTTLANQTAVAFESARLYSAEQSRREELDALYNLTRQLVANDEVDAVLQNTIRMIVQNAHVTYARILIMDGANNLRCRAVFPVRDLDNTLGDGRVEPASIRTYYDAALARKQNDRAQPRRPVP